MRNVLERFSSAESRRSLMTVAVSVIVIVLFLAASIAIVAVIQKDYELKKGASDGFRLNGMYTTGIPCVDSGYCTAAFLEGTSDGFESAPHQKSGFDGKWQLTGSDVVDGFYRKTFDPNVFDLYDEAGRRVGFAHLAYTTGQTDGLIYVTYESHRIVLSKTDNLVCLQA